MLIAIKDMTKTVPCDCEFETARLVLKRTEDF